MTLICSNWDFSFRASRRSFGLGFYCVWQFNPEPPVPKYCNVTLHLGPVSIDIDWQKEVNE